MNGERLSSFFGRFASLTLHDAALLELCTITTQPETFLLVIHDCEARVLRAFLVQLSTQGLKTPPRTYTRMVLQSEPRSQLHAMSIPDTQPSGVGALLHRPPNRRCDAEILSNCENLRVRDSQLKI